MKENPEHIGRRHPRTVRLTGVLWARSVIDAFGIDSAIGYSLVSKGFSAVAQPAMLYFIASSLSAVEQGYYYTFYSVLALNIFLELGLGVVITHFAANEFGSLRWEADGTLIGDEIALARLMSLFLKSLAWYSAVVVLASIGLVTIGLRLFEAAGNQGEVHYAGPWVLLILATGIGTGAIPIIAFLAGCGRIADLQRIKLAQNVVATAVFCAALILGARLYAPALMQASQCVVFLAWFATAFHPLVRQVATCRRGGVAGDVSWTREILPMQWRVAGSWLSAYFMNYTFNPLLFAYRSAAEAGQMGMTRSLADMVLNTGMIWLNTNSVTYGAYVMRADYVNLDRVATRSTIRGMLVAASAGIVVIAAATLVKQVAPAFDSRILSIPALSCLIVSGVIGIAVSSMGEYLRAHKQEPYLSVNLVLALLVTLTNWFSVRYYDANMMAYLYSAVTVGVGVPLASRVFLLKRRYWQAVAT